MLKAGIVGLPNVGKSTLFNALVANAQAQAAYFPFCTIEPNVGTVSVPDERLQRRSSPAARRLLTGWSLLISPACGCPRPAWATSFWPNPRGGRHRPCGALL